MGEGGGVLVEDTGSSWSVFFIYILYTLFGLWPSIGIGIVCSQTIVCIRVLHVGLCIFIFVGGYVCTCINVHASMFSLVDMYV